jgi:hypothetical protein
MKKYFVFFILILIIGCSTTEQLLYETNYPLTNKIVKSGTLNFSVNIPQGWFTSKENIDNIIDIWLLEDKLSAQIAFSALNTSNFDKSISLKDVLNFSQRQKKAELGNKYKEVIPNEHFYINAIEYFSYQYFDDNNLPVRVVIFSVNNNFIECVASFSGNIYPEKAKPSTLFKVQNSVLSSMSIK